jgi:hypothetical protein
LESLSSSAAHRARVRTTICQPISPTLRVLALSALTVFGVACKPPAADHSAHSPALFELETLVGKSIDDIRAALGQPTDSEPEPSALQHEMDFSEWNNTFDVSGHEVLVTFNPQTRQVIDLFVDGSDATTLYHRWGLNRTSPLYTLEPVKSLRDPSQITGIKIVPR